jgi:hypothetical protein
MNSDINDLDVRREEYVGDLSEYGCRSLGPAQLRLASPGDGDNIRHVVGHSKYFLLNVICCNSSRF